jgi:DNA polymerase III subunit gamma/tau
MLNVGIFSTIRRSKAMYRLTYSKLPNDPLGKKYQPQQIDDFVGNTDSLFKLNAILENHNHNRGYLIFGPYGIGKTSLGLAIAKFVGACDWDTHLVDLAIYKDVKKMRRVMDGFRYRPHGKARVFIFDEAHAIAKAIQQELLWWLDNPPRALHLIFCTADPKNVIVPLRDRCFQVALQPLEFKERMQLLLRICKGERIELDRGVLKAIARQSDGIPRALVNGLLAEMALIKKVSKGRSTEDKINIRSAK